ncbi:MAG: nitrate- and nitrite sensing domain-containing protein [Micromonosporaceae bacterium]|nr:nitrate- and nitrite sensing domain-containing protein [Micromonosporaceae bacterium]
MILGKVRIRGKLALLTAIPLLAVAALTVPLVLDQVRHADRAGQTVRAMRIASGVGALVQELQLERMQAAGYLVQIADQSELTEQTAKVLDRMADLRADLGEDLPAEVSAAVEAIRDLGPIRSQVLSRTVPPEQAMAAFSTVIARLISSLHLGERLDMSALGSREVVALDAVLRLDEGINTGAAYMVIAAATRSPAAMSQLGSVMATTQASVERVQTFATPEQFALYTLVQEAFEARAGRDFLTGYPADPVGTISRLSAPTLFPTLLSFITLGRFVERKISTEVTAQVTSEQRQALVLAYATAGLSVAVLLLVVVLSLVVAGAVVRPLIRLTRSAEQVAGLAEAELERVADDESEAAMPVQLAPVEVAAQDEIGDLARAFDRVQQTAARLVERQVASRRNVAQMFGHVGRRTQNLVGRQIALIDQLERGEQDPSRLQQLYRLDHVSSRLRRSASSLVVLSGAAGAEPHVAPVQLGDVVRLALGEIEDYTRVDLSVPDDLVVAPALVGDLVLMLAELMENATNFSPPHTRVTVTANRTVTGTGAQLAIVDHGLGMPPDRLAEENARLARRERLDLAPTEVLGLFVVGRLARRHGIGVTLSATPGGGVTAVVELAQHMLVPVPLEPEANTLHLIDPATAPARAALPAAPSAPLASLATRTDPPFDVAALERATRTLTAGPTWNAFATDERPVRTAAPSDRPAAAPSDGRASAGEALIKPEATGGASTEPAATSRAPVAGEAATNATAEPADAARSRPALRRRVRGAQLPPGTSPRPAEPTRSFGDPDSARTLVEEFEAGVRRALGEMVNGSRVDVPVSPAGKSPLTRRVPGATLWPAGERSGPPPVDHQPLDPEQARRLVEQFESGVNRALREVGSDHRPEQEETR